MEQVVVAIVEGIGSVIGTLIQVIIIGIINSLARGIRGGTSRPFLQPAHVVRSSHSANTNKKGRTGEILLFDLYMSLVIPPSER